MSNAPKVAGAPAASSQPSNPFAALDSFVAGGSTDSSEPPPSDPSEQSRETSSAAQAPRQATPVNEAADSDGIEAGDVETAAAPKKYLEVPVTDERGRRMVKVDLSDEDGLKQVVARAHQAKQLLSRVNKAEDSNKKLQTEMQELKTNWLKLNEVFQQHGEEGLIDMLKGKKGAFKEWEEQRFARRKFMETASEEEIRQAQMEERLNQLERERHLAVERSAAKDKEYAEKEEATATQDLINRFTPVFNKYRFEGQLGDADAEDMLDSKIWEKAISTIEAVPEDELNQNIITSAFRDAYSKISKVMNVKAKTEAKRQVEATKKQATQSVQAAVKGQRVSSNAAAVEKAKSDIRTGNLGDFFLDALHGKVKFRR